MTDSVRPHDRAYNDPDLGPIEFFEAIMHEDTLSYALRMKAEKLHASVIAGARQSSVIIHIPDPVSDEYIRRFPRQR
jgi:hypothetical protein